MSLRVLAVADSESFLKWAATTLDRLEADGIELEQRVVVIRGPLEPSPAQAHAALAGTGTRTVNVVGRRRLAALVAAFRPDAVLVAATGPVAELIALTVLRGATGVRPVLLSGPPGMAMSMASATGVRWRARWCDVYVVHSPREVELFTRAFADADAAPQMVVSRLPFLDAAREGTGAPVHRIVFAPQPIVPHSRAERIAILAGLVRLRQDGFEVVVKLRARAGEQQTHHEALPFDVLWHQEHARLGAELDAVRFVAGPLSSWLTPGTALVTVSSTAALESLSLGLPTALVADFGVAPALANEVFADSGCMVRLDQLAETLRRGGPVPVAQWLAETYLHDLPSTLGETLRELVAARDSGSGARHADVRPISPLIHLYSALKSDLPALWYPAKWVRTLLGRFVQLT